MINFFFFKEKIDDLNQIIEKIGSSISDDEDE